MVDPRLLYGPVRIAVDAARKRVGEMRFSQKISFAILAAAIASNAHAGEARTTYKISSSRTTVTTEVSKASPTQAKVLESYLFETLAANLKSFHGVDAVVIPKSAARTETVEDFQDSREYIRHYQVQVKLSLPSPVTLTFTVEESYRKCKAGYACVPSSYLKVSSPFQQDVSIEAARDAKETLLIVSNYNLNSVILGGKGNSERTTIMVAAARALRVNNEKMVE
jgi:hypothetical protein